MKGIRKLDPINLLSRKVSNWLHKCNGIDQFKMYVDVSFPEEMVYRQKGRMNLSRAPRIHYHGIIMFGDIHSFLMSVPNEYYEMVGMVNIDTISDFNGWTKYCRKYINHAFPKQSLYKHFPYILKYDASDIYITESSPPKGINKWLLQNDENKDEETDSEENNLYSILGESDVEQNEGASKSDGEQEG